MKHQDCTDLPKITIEKQIQRELKSQNLISMYSVFFPLFLAILYMTLTLNNLFIRFDNGYKMDDLAKFVSAMVNKFSDPEDFINALEKTDKPEKEKSDYFFEIGDRLYKVSNFKLALKVWNKALEYYLKLNNKAGEAKCYRALGCVYAGLSDCYKDIEYQNKALEISKVLGDKAGEAKCYINLSADYTRFGEIQKAIEYLNKSLAIAIAIGDQARESYCYNNLGNVYITLSNFDKAIEYYNKSLEISKAIGDKRQEAFCYDNLGSVYIFSGDFHKALKYFIKGLEVFRAIGDKEYEAKSYNSLGIANWNLGNLHKAIEYNRKALEIQIAIGNKKGEAQSYINFGEAYGNLGNFRKALEYYRKSLEIKKAISDKNGEAFCCQNMGECCAHFGDFPKAIEYNNQSLEIFRAIGDKRGEAYCYNSLGNFFNDSGDFHKAIESLSKALEITKEIGAKPVEATIYNTLGNAYHRSGDFNKAIEYHNKSLEIAKKIGSKEEEYKCYNSLGGVYASLKDFGKAIEYHKRAFEIVEELKDVYSKKTILGNIGDAYFNRENFKEGEIYYKQSVEIIENLRRENIPKEYKRSFWKDNIPIFDNLIISDLKLGKKEEALENSERGKSRTVFDFILGRGIEEKFKPEPLSFKEIQELANRIEKNLVLFRVTEKGTYTFIVHPSIREGAGRREQGAAFELLEFPEFNAKRLEELTVKLEAGKSTGGWIHAYSNYKSVQENVNKLRAEKEYIEAGKAIKEAEGTWFKTMDDTLKTLYDELMGKVFSRFDKGEKVVLIPNRALNILPLHACFYEEYPSPKPSPTRGEGFKGISSPSMGEDKGEGEKRFKRRYLIEDYDINYAPNCNILDLCHKREAERREEGGTLKEERRRKRDESTPSSFRPSSARSLFAIANPSPPYELAFSEWEVEEIAKLFDNKEVFSKQAAKDALVNNADSYEVIHLSTHGIYDLGSSFNSRLRLGRDSDLTLEEILEKVRISKSWLVCLSACESGLTDYRDIADEYIGLQTGFLCAGAPTVIASLWTINDFPTAFIMIKTYESIFKEGLKKSEALRKAQLWLKELTAEDALKLLKDKELELESSVKMAVKDISPLKIAISSKDPKSKPFSHPYYWAGFQAIGA